MYVPERVRCHANCDVSHYQATPHSDRAETPGSPKGDRKEGGAEECTVMSKD